MKLYELFKGTEYVGEFTLDEIISITGAHRSALLNRNDDNSLLKQFEAVTGQIRRCVKREQ